MPVIAPCGSWKSPIIAELIAGQTVAFGGLVADGADLYWSESRPREGGRHTIVRYRDGTIEERLPPPFNARSRVHEYGGGAFTVDGGVLYFSNHVDNRIYRQIEGELPQPVTPEAPWRYADLVFDAVHRRLIAVSEQHAGDREPVNTLVAIDSMGKTAPLTLAAGHDFYASPALSPDGRRLAWLAWNHPNMPWDGSELWLADIDADGRLSNAQRIAGGESEAANAPSLARGPRLDPIGESIFQPQFSSDGTLYFVSDRTGWWNLYRWRGERAEPIWPRDAEFGLPQWVFGLSTYTFLGEWEIAAAFQEGGRWRLVRLDTRTLRVLAIDVPDTDIGGLRSQEGALVYVGASPVELSAIVRLDPAHGRREVLRRSAALDLDPDFLSVPESLEFPSANGETARGYFYPPHNRDHTPPPDETANAPSLARGPRLPDEVEGPEARMPRSGLRLDPIGEAANAPSLARGPRLDPIGEKPPLLVMSHGGPTSAASSALNLKIQYWTSRGFAVLDVNYRGSTGFGRAYREKLNGRWGVADVEDCVNGARFLVRQGRVDERRLAIRGGSAGGYTTLCALVFHDVFRAAAVYYGVSDLEALTRETHKFEAHYLDRLIGPYPETRELYRERSPIHHVGRLSCPVIFFQGLDDKVVPPDQTERMVEVLRRKRVPVAYVPFEGEAHGFRRAENIARALEAELYFYLRVFGLVPGEKLSPVAIENLD
jgi:dipeptidyl aminopeptidase/acylaminoacyl peptidase